MSSSWQPGERSERALRVRQGHGEVTARDGMGVQAPGARRICVYGRHQRGIGAQDGIMTPSGLIGLSPWLAWRVDGHRDLPAGGYQELPAGGHLGR